MTESRKTENTQLSDVASFSVTNSSTSDKDREITFFYDDPEREYKSLMVVTFPLGDPPLPTVERAMRYAEEDHRWLVTLDRPADAREKFIIIPNVTPNDKIELKQKAPVLQEGYIALKNGVQQPVNKIPGTPKGKLELCLYTKDGEIKKVKKAVNEDKLRKGDRLITIYFPPGYDQKRKPPYDLQVTLDGGQYLETMQMHTIMDNLIAEKKIEPVVNIFISPYNGPPDPKEEGIAPVTPPGYSIVMRFKEYSCNPEFAKKLSSLPSVLREQFQFNITDDPKHTTIWGLSMGGLQATYTALIYPDTFGNVVGQSPMAWWNGADIDREKITDRWESTTTTLLENKPEDEEAQEYLKQAIKAGVDRISGRPISKEKLNFYFDSGEAEEEYNREKGSADLVGATRRLAKTLDDYGHSVVNIVTPGGHDAMTWMGNIPDAASITHPPRTVELAKTASKENASRLPSVSSRSLFSESKNSAESAESAEMAKKKKGLDITDEEMAKNAFGRGSSDRPKKP
jgi:enterochelin esterase-like enzyme